MQKFFRGWKRKSGLLTLMVTVVLALGWVRSLSTGDQSTIRMSDNALFWMVSNSGWFGCVVVLEPKAGSSSEFFRRWSDRSSSHRLDMGPFDGMPYDWDWESYPHFILPYWTLVIPLTLLSMYLLLWMPRTVKHQLHTMEYP